MKKPNENEVFEYLDTLRDSGKTNMIGAGVYIEVNFKVGPGEAKRLLLKWMKTFAQRMEEKNAKSSN